MLVMNDLVCVCGLLEVTFNVRSKICESNVQLHEFDWHGKYDYLFPFRNVGRTAAGIKPVSHR